MNPLMPLEVMIPIKALRALIALERPIQPPSPHHPRPHPHPIPMHGQPAVALRGVQRVPSSSAAGLHAGVHELVLWRGGGVAEERELRAGGVDVGHYGAGERGEGVGVGAVGAAACAAGGGGGG